MKKSQKTQKELKSFMQTKLYKAYAQEQDALLDLAIDLKRIRQKKGFTQAALAQQMGMAQPTIARMEKSGQVNARMLVKFCLATNTKLKLVTS